MTLRALGRWTFRFLRVTVTIGLLAFVIRRAGGEAIANELQKLSPAWLAAGTIVNVALIWVAALRWRVLIAPRPAGLTLATLARVYLASYFMGAIGPGTLGMDAVRILLLARRGIGRTAAAVSVTADRAVGLVGTLLVAMPVLITSGVLAKLAVLPPPLARLGETAGRAREALAILAREPWRLPTGVVITVMAVSMWAVVGWCTLAALGHTVPYHLLVGFIACGELAASMPISVQGVGVRELVFAAMLGPLGVTPAEATLLGLLMYAQTLVITGCGAVVVMFSQDMSPKVRTVQGG